MDGLESILSFIKEAEELKNVTRTAWTSKGRRESTAEHSWRLALLVMMMQRDFPEIDILKAIKMCLIHDLGEIYEGDISAKLIQDEKDKYNREENALKKLTRHLSKESREELLSLWYEYNECQTEESKLVKALDKMETIVQHNQGMNPENFDYGFNLNYGKKYFEYNEILKSMRSIIDRETSLKVEK